MKMSLIRTDNRQHVMCSVYGVGTNYLRLVAVECLDRSSVCVWGEGWGWGVSHTIFSNTMGFSEHLIKYTPLSHRLR